MTHEDLKTLTVEEVAELMGVHPETVRRWVRDGRLQAMRWGDRLRFKPEAIRKFQEACQVHIPTPAENLKRLADRRRVRKGTP
jgi:excisionase family DNA binding protein